MEEMLVLGITGLRGAGKDTAAYHMEKKHGFHVLTFTNDVLAPMLKTMGKEVVRQNLVDLGMDLRKEFGPAATAELISERIHLPGRYAISGVRTKEEVEYFREKYGEQFRLISVRCDEKKRYQRIKNRKTKGEHGLSLKEFREIENKPTETPIPETMRLADFTVDNNKTKTNLFRQIDAMMKKI